MQSDLEETKGQEVTKLRDVLHEMQLQVEESNSMLMKEREAAKAIEKIPQIIKETPVLVEDTTKINALTAEIEILKVLQVLSMNVTYYSLHNLRFYNNSGLEIKIEFFG